jgi:DNA-binding transcriptional LysR family regulator
MRRAFPDLASSVGALRVLPRIATGEMVEILPHHTCEPLPLSLVHAHGRNVPRHVRVVMNWLAEILRAEFD